LPAGIWRWTESIAQLASRMAHHDIFL